MNCLLSAAVCVYSAPIYTHISICQILSIEPRTAEMRHHQKKMHQQLSILIEKCRGAQDVDSQIILLREINHSLPHCDRLEMPSLITDDYCRRALEVIEDRIARALKISSREFSWP